MTDDELMACIPKSQYQLLRKAGEPTRYAFTLPSLLIVFGMMTGEGRARERIELMEEITKVLSEEHAMQRMTDRFFTD